VAGGYIFKHVAAGRFGEVRLPSIPILGAAVFLAGAAVLASLVPAARASRVDVVQALRSE
jgi:ABC-type lipoprotein release transport system permease subunit